MPPAAYAGIGSRQTPESILIFMARMGALLAQEGFILRSGAAPGADSAFESGCDMALGRKEIFLPWSGFQGRRPEGGVQLLRPDIAVQASAIAEQAHPRWQRLKQPVRLLMARNVAQVLGPSLNAPVRFVLCWTPAGRGSGGTGQALRVAGAWGVPVLDMGKPKVLDRVTAWLSDPSLVLA